MLLSSPQPVRGSIPICSVDKSLSHCVGHGFLPRLNIGTYSNIYGEKSELDN
jgi:hypothetical protein